MKPRSRRERVAHARSCARAIDSYLDGKVRRLTLRDILAQSISPNAESGQSVYGGEARKLIKRATDALDAADATNAYIVERLAEARRAYMGVRK